MTITYLASVFYPLSVRQEAGALITYPKVSTAASYTLLAKVKRVKTKQYIS